MQPEGTYRQGGRSNEIQNEIEDQIQDGNQDLIQDGNQDQIQDGDQARAPDEASEEVQDWDPEPGGSRVEGQHG